MVVNLEDTEMANSSASLLVVLDGEYKPDDAESIAKAIQMIKGVLSVSVVPAGSTYYTAKQVAKSELRQQICGILDTTK